MPKKISDITKSSDNFAYGILGYTGQATEDKSCLLKFANNRIELVIPFEGRATEVSDWFVDDGLYSPTISKSESVPKQVWVRDLESKKKFILLDPFIARSSVTIGTDKPVGQGILTARYVVVGNPGTNYMQVHGMRTSYPELASWSR